MGTKGMTVRAQRWLEIYVTYVLGLEMKASFPND